MRQSATYLDITFLITILYERNCRQTIRARNVRITKDTNHNHGSKGPRYRTVIADCLQIPG